MTNSWLKVTFPIAAIYAFRMLGLFMLIPIFSVYGANLHGATPIWIGVALGSYGFSQGMMQIPFGILSDYVGRKPMLVIGLSLFALGSIWGAMTDSIYGMVGARILQGCGAVGSVLIALLADLIPDEQRAKSMAVIGICIGLSFATAMIISPIISKHYGLSGIFQLTIFFALCGIFIVYAIIPTPEHQKPSSFSKNMLINNFVQADLLKCHLGIFTQHLVLTSSFFAIPLLLKQAQIPLTHFYLTLMIGAFIIMIPLVGWAEKNQLRNQLFQKSLLLIIVGQVILAIFNENTISLWLGLFLYFTAFNILEALLPAMIAKAADQKLKGTATGIYSTAQFLGIFVGGLTSGLTYQHFQATGIFIINALLMSGYALYQKRIA
jgi:MFS family permease